MRRRRKAAQRGVLDKRTEAEGEGREGKGTEFLFAFPDDVSEAKWANPTQQT